MTFMDRLLHGPERQRHVAPSDNRRRLQLLLSYLPGNEWIESCDRPMAMRPNVDGPDKGKGLQDHLPSSQWYMYWLLTVILLVLIGVLTDHSGFKREFSLTDTSIQHSYAVKERISFGLDIGLSAGVPAVIIILVGLIWHRSFWDVHAGLLGLFLTCSITTVVTQVVKICVGRPRPDMLARCLPIAGAANAEPFGLATIAVCSVQTGNIINDGFKSFPSGHSSFAFAGLGYLSFYMAGKMHLYDTRGHAIKAWICITPWTGAGLIAISRTMDYRHHATDVIAGSLLGTAITVLTYHLYYPSILDPSCDLPYSPRIARTVIATLNGNGKGGMDDRAPSGTTPRPSTINQSHQGPQTHVTPEVALEEGRIGGGRKYDRVSSTDACVY
ncbi:BQ2448_1177 [Microbotryum intermedium]|uniref:BQ2448_1177 protein n=1 Tax=Microbotryum intermedium TaxID=269621 RepID=A0A238FCQ0_9BASI|nr:BQ2448_1177 [Microbotryum intermedium]